MHGHLSHIFVFFLINRSTSHTMEKVEEDTWSFRDIISSFRVVFEAGRPRNLADDPITFTSSRGLGWRFGIGSSQSAIDVMRYKVELYIDTTSVCSDLGSLAIRVYLEAEDTEHVKSGRQELSTIPLPSSTCRLAEWDPTDNLLSLHLTFTVSFVMPLQRPRPIENSATLGNILQKSISTGALVDTKFYVFTQRTPSGALARPRPLFASAKLLQDKLDYFKRMFAPNVYRESTLLPLDGDFPFEPEPYVHNYDYDPDSDLEETYEETELPGDTKSVDGFEYIAAGSIPSDEDIYSPEIRLPGAFDPISTQPEYHTIYAGRLSRNPGPLQRKGRVVIIKDAAFDTWQALLFYLYTGDIAFRPLKSQQEIRPKTSFQEDGHGGEQAWPQPCSPKSMYRLADKVSGCVIIRFELVPAHLYATEARAG
ncbi:hypothetical protein NEOLEDRAFT_1123756 [Neolentinus lepideus HHB14362 ss-1]|uniref:BTB domain-containing protein n=1 Tax=Neolentinus lepideus HHB14362 ss-1 TaxID=1314782 RepID=A0A165NIQ3_9AGAM|nr:hypothetical protein NEOLEDRAFT_1123756 [Neolentinus lepideus HHB14362 ss-1]